MPYKIKEITKTTYIFNHYCKQRYIIVAIVIFELKGRAVGTDHCD